MQPSPSGGWEAQAPRASIAADTSVREAILRVFGITAEAWSGVAVICFVWRVRAPCQSHRRGNKRRDNEQENRPCAARKSQTGGCRGIGRPRAWRREDNPRMDQPSCWVERRTSFDSVIIRDASGKPSEWDATMWQCILEWQLLSPQKQVTEWLSLRDTGSNA